MKRMIMIALVAGVAALGCEEKTEPAPAEAKSPSSMEKAAPKAEAEPMVTDEQIATPEDFEEEAQQQITSDNLDDELEKLEKEIGDEG